MRVTSLLRKQKHHLYAPESKIQYNTLYLASKVVCKTDEMFLVRFDLNIKLLYGRCTKGRLFCCWWKFVNRRGLHPWGGLTVNDIFGSSRTPPPTDVGANMDGSTNISQHTATKLHWNFIHPVRRYLGATAKLISACHPERTK